MKMSFASRLRRACCLCTVVVFSAMFAVADGANAVVADFSGSEQPANWTVENGEYRSPGYDAPVDRIELRYNSTGAEGSAAVYASSDAVETQIATFSAASAAASFDFPETTDFRSFRIATANGLALSSFAAYVSASAIDQPDGVAISNNTTGTSFDASWNPVAGATGYRVYVWTNVVAGASAGDVVWQETFANSPAKDTSTAFNVSYTDSGNSEWTFDKVYAHNEAGKVRIGNTSAKGVLVSPALGDEVAAGDLLTLRLRTWKQESKDGDFMPIGIVSGDATNILEVLEITTTPTDYHIKLPEISATDRIAILSPTNKSYARAILDDVVIISGYSEGQDVPSYIINGHDVGEATFYQFTDLPSVPVFFAVEAYGKRGVASPTSGAVEVDLSNPDKVAVLNACPISSLEERTYTQNFDSLTNLTTSGNVWLNGTTLPYWQAYMDGVAIKTISFYKGGTGTGAGFFALSSNENNSARAFGARLKQSTFAEWSIAFSNDTNSAICLDNVRYRAEQWGFANDKERHSLSLSYLVTNKLDWIVCYGAESWINCTSTETPCLKDDSHKTPETVEVAVSPSISIQPGEILVLKWRFDPPTQGGSALMAIDDVKATFNSLKNSGFSIRLASKSIRP